MITTDLTLSILTTLTSVSRVQQLASLIRMNADLQAQIASQYLPQLSVDPSAVRTMTLRSATARKVEAMAQRANSTANTSTSASVFLLDLVLQLQVR